MYDATYNAIAEVLGVYNSLIYLPFFTLFLRFVLPFIGHFPTPPNLHRTEHFLDLEI